MKGQIEAAHLTRRAFVYVRQSTMAQVVHHQESTMMQYDLRQRAVPLGWAPEAIEGIDEAQARRGTTTDGRSGFARLAGAVAPGEAGGVFAIDVSPMARSAEDWRRLLVLGGVAGVAVVDEQRIYDPNDHDAKLLLALKGTMSEAEIHWRRLRLQGGAAAQGAPWRLAAARPDRIPLGRAGLRDGSRRGRAAGRARRLSAVRRRAECVGGGAGGAPDGVHVSNATNLGGRGLRGGVEIPRGLAHP